MDPILGTSGLFGTSSSVIDPLLALELSSINSALTGQVSPLGDLGTATALASTAVELSGVGQVLSALDTFQNSVLSVAQATANTTGVTIAATPAAAVTTATATTAAQTLVNAFNTLGAVLNNLNAPLGPLNGQPLTNGLTTALNAFVQNPVISPNNAATTLATTTQTTAPVPTTLAQIGITFQPAATPGQVGALTFDENAFQAALTASGTGTVTLLNQAALGLGGLAANFSGANGALALVATALGQTEDALTLFDIGNVSNTTAVFLGINQLPSGTLTPQQIAAVQQYAQVFAMAAIPAFESNVLSGL